MLPGAGGKKGKVGPAYDSHASSVFADQRNEASRTVSQEPPMLTSKPAQLANVKSCFHGLTRDGNWNFPFFVHSFL